MLHDLSCTRRSVTLLALCVIFLRLGHGRKDVPPPI